MLRGKKRRAKIKRKSKDERGDEASWLTLDVEVLSFTQFHAPRDIYVVAIVGIKNKYHGGSASPISYH